MSQPKFTPGPWFVFGNGHCVGGPSDVAVSGTAGIAMCGMALRDPEEAKANALLIAAAPDLFAALVGVTEEMELADFDPADPDTWYGRALEILARAEGRKA
jgi:hypothetical protein